MHPIRFKPFIGKNYHSQDFKILVLGESHYLNTNQINDYQANKEYISNITNQVVTGFFKYKNRSAKYERWMNTFTKFGNVIHGNRLNPSQTLAFWDSCAFYNYVQVPTAGPRIYPTKEDFQNSISALKQVIKETNPDIVMVWGYRLWHNLPVKNTEKIFRTSKIHFTNIDPQLPFKRMPHPSSSAFNYKMSPSFKSYIKNVKILRSQ